ncbi:MAG: hypothetical protein KGJ66_09310 [Alphaproteobacteria bacterium]|nr:hypothetical protein [Alphaproteobacteria bacterium]
MERWIARMNIARYKRQLQGALDDAERRAVEKLLAEEEARLKALERSERIKS